MLAGSMLACSGAAIACSDAWWSAAAGPERSEWQEIAAQGRTLVREAGTLGTVALAAGGRCSGWLGSARWAGARGTRAYQGVTVANAPIETLSTISRHRLELDALRPFGAMLSAGARVAYQHTLREIADVGRVRGYPERFSQWEFAAGAEARLVDRPALRLSAQLWLGAGPPGRLELELPNADPAVLRLGSSRSQQFGIDLQGGLPAAGAVGWQWQLQAASRRDTTAAGPAQVILRQGLPIGGAAQPETRQTGRWLRIGVQHGF
ncbi:MAG: hypothetical protein JNL87_16900 [Burkholderiaceae bacterium]|nr:hypothetical protein [Burkholderiaceae bacterium]